MEEVKNGKPSLICESQNILTGEMGTLGHHSMVAYFLNRIETIVVSFKPPSKVLCILAFKTQFREAAVQKIFE